MLLEPPSEGIASHAVRANSARTKAKLLAFGIQDSPDIFADGPSFKQDNYAYDNGNWGVSPDRAVPSEIRLPGNIVSKLHIRPGSSLRIVREGTSLAVVDGRGMLSECEFLSEPTFWSYSTASGQPTKRIAQFYGATCINVNIYSGCQFFSVDKACAFCSVQPTQIAHRKVVINKTPGDLADACGLAVSHDRVNWYLQTGGSYLGGDREFDAHVAALRAIRPVLPWGGRFRGNVAMMPPRDLGRIKELFDLGVDHPGFNLEVWPRTAFEKFCPGKAEYVGFDHIMRAFDSLVAFYGAGWGWCNFVAGLVSLEDQKAGFSAVAERGIIPGANVFHPDVGSTLGDSHSSPDEYYILSLYAHAAELYHRYDYRPFFDAEVLRNSLANEAYEGLL